MYDCRRKSVVYQALGIHIINRAGSFRRKGTAMLMRWPSTPRGLHCLIGPAKKHTRQIDHSITMVKVIIIYLVFGLTFSLFLNPILANDKEPSDRFVDQMPATEHITDTTVRAPLKIEAKGSPQGKEPSKPPTTTEDTDASASECKLLSIWNFDSGIRTDQRGHYSHFSAGGSKMNINLTRDVHRGPHGRSLRIFYNKTINGYGGTWMHLYDDDNISSEKKRYLDVSGYPYLSFWVKGQGRGENFTVQMADPKWNAQEDSKPAGTVSQYLDGGITKEWKEVIIPYEDFGLENFQASSLVFNFTEKGHGVVCVDDINFKRNAHCNVPFSQQDKSFSQGKRQLVRAMWVWNTEPLLFDTDYREEFFSFCRRYGVNEIFLQLPYQFENASSAQVKCTINHPMKLRSLIKQLRKNGIVAHALDGYPEFALTEYHPRVLAQISALIEFNRNSSPEERYFGIHLDNEPYLLLGFEGELAHSILLQFLDLNQKIMDLLRKNASDIVYGIDIPFWFDEAKDDKGLPKYSIHYNGQTKNITHHLIDIVDNIGVMNYRNFAGGADGMIRHGEGEITYANAVGKKVYLGVETFKDEPLSVSFIYSKSHDSIHMSSRFKNYRIRVIDAGLHRLMGLVRPTNPEDREAFEATLIELYSLYGQTNAGHIPDMDKIESRAETVVNNHPEYHGFNPFVLKDSNGQILAAGFDTTEVMLDKITFAGHTKGKMERVLSEVAEAYISKESFIGFAIHYYKTYKGMPD